MKSIFQNYTGNAFVNNALQTIEALANLDHVSEITPEILLVQYKKHELWNLYKRMKSYSMLFTRNGPLLNDLQYGEKIYQELFEHIIKNFENDGNYICEISGLKFRKTFEEIYIDVLRKISYPETKIAEKDKTINRCWFPLVGALGSDAQALPQAKFGIKIHPITLVIIQFLPFSALIYKGGILLFDSINFEFSKDFIQENVQRVLEEIQLTPNEKSIENIKDFNKGTYLLRAMRLFSEKKHDYADVYSDLNLWSFSNSGTGANCEIDRVPNPLFKQLLGLYEDIECKSDLEKILRNSEISNWFLEKFESKEDFWALYPTKKLDGVGVPFYEAYQKAIGNGHQLKYARFIAYLLSKNEDIKPTELKLLDKTDAYSFSEYAFIVQTTLIKAAKEGIWSIVDHLRILDKPDILPVNSGIYSIFKKVHFYYQKKEKYLSQNLLDIDDFILVTNAAKVCAITSSLTTEYGQAKNIDLPKRLTNPQEYKSYNLNPIFIHFAARLSLEEITAFYYSDYKQHIYGINELLRIYFSNPVKIPVPTYSLEVKNQLELLKYKIFSELYIHYYFSKYQNKLTLEKPYSKFSNHILKKFPKSTGLFRIWLEDAKSNILSQLDEQPEWTFTELSKIEIDQLFEDILYDGNGMLNLSFARFAIEFSLNKQFSLTHKNIEI